MKSTHPDVSNLTGRRAGPPDFRGFGGVAEGTLRRMCRLSAVAALLAASLPAVAAAQVNIRAISVASDTDAVAGAPMEIVAVFQSDGAQAAPSFRWRAFLTLAGSLDGALPIATLGPTTLSSDQPEVVTVSPALPNGLSGHFTLALVADHDDSVAETNEYDNIAIASGSIHVRAEAPDLSVQTVSANAAERRADEALDVDFTLDNTGELDALVTVGAYLSRDPVITPSDLLLGTTDLSVSAGQSAAGSIAGLVPTGTQVGDYHVGVVVDPAGLVTEISETNNGGEAGRLNVYEDTLALTTETVPNGTLTIDYHLLLQAAGGDGHYEFLVLDGALPDGLTLSREGELSGTPSRTGPFEFTIQVRSRGLMDERSFSVEVVSTFQPLRIVTDEVQDGFHHLPYQQILVAGGGEPPYTFRLTPEAGALPPGLDLSTSGVISGIPTTLGHYSFGITVEDRLGARDSVLYETQVVPKANVLILNTEQPVGVVGQPMDYELHVTGGVPPFIWEAASSPPPGLSVTEDGHISGVPERVGTWPVRVRVTDGTRQGVQDTALFQVRVEDDEAFRIVATQLPSGLVRSRYEAVITADGGTPPYTWSLGPGESLPDGFFLSQGDGETHSTDAAVIVGRAFRPLVHGFSVVVEDALGRQRTLPYALVIESGNTSFETGCTCAAPRAETGMYGLFLLAGALFFRRRR